MSQKRLEDLKTKHGIQSNIDNTNRFKKFTSKIHQFLSFKVKKIPIIAIIIAFVFFAINLSLVVTTTPKKLDRHSNLIAQKFTNILTNLRNQKNLEKTYKEAFEVVVELQKDLKKIDQRLWPILSTGDLVGESWYLAREWLEASADLTKFRITADGFTSDLPRNFTDYLEGFFEKLPYLLDKTEDFIYKIKMYVSWGFWIPSSNLNKLRSALDLSDDIILLMRDIYLNRVGILEFLGYKSVHKILIFNQNIGESRPTGGFIGSYIPLNITQGRFDIGQSQTIYKVDQDQKNSMLSFPISWYYDLQYGRYDIHGIRNLNYFSCFPDSAKLIESEFSRSPKGQNADSIVFLTPNLIQNLFSDSTTLKIKLDDSNEITTITKSNFYEIVEKLTAIDFNDIYNPKSAITPILVAILSNLEKIIANQDPIQIGLQTLGSGSTRDIQIWSKSSKVQKIWQNFNLAGTQTCHNQNKKCLDWWVRLQDLDCFWDTAQTPNLSIIQANLSSDKRDFFANHLYNITVRPNQGSAYKIELNYERTYKGLEGLQRKYNSRNGVTFIGFVLPSDARDYTLTSEQSLATPFLRPFYQVKIKERYQQELYTPEMIESVISSSYDLNSTSFTYRQPDQSLVIGTYLNEEDITKVKLTYNSSLPYTLFYPFPATNNNQITVDSKTRVSPFNQLDIPITQAINSSGEGVVISYY